MRNLLLEENLSIVDKAFRRLEKNFKNFSLVEAYNRTVILVHILASEVLKAEMSGWKREEIRALLSNTWRIHGYSSFGKYLQTWPRGYMGDFKAIDMIIDYKEENPPNTLGGILGRYALNTPIAQQHREKIKVQSCIIKKTCEIIPRPKILSLACGSSRDLEMAKKELEKAGAEILLVDFDADALRESVRRLTPNLKVETFLSNVRLKKFFREISAKNNKFNLILAGGLFDYLPEKIVKMIIKNLKNFLSKEGLFFFTNIASGNPYRPWIETVTNWFLIERSKTDINRVLDPSYFSLITRDLTGLTWMVYLSFKTFENPCLI